MLTPTRLLLVILAFAASGAQARDRIRVVGSGTVYPFATLVAEQFGEEGSFHTPVVEATGTGGGFKVFCAGYGPQTPDINDASRPMTESERLQCTKNGVRDVVTVTLGFDGIVLAAGKGEAFALTKTQLFRALARQLPDAHGKLSPNPYHRWREIDAALPDKPIRVYGPSTVSGTRDAFGELVMEEGCSGVPAFAAAVPDEKERRKTCQLIREDGSYIEAGEDYNILVQKISGDAGALGIFGFNFYNENLSRIDACSIDGVQPLAGSIASGEYKVARRLFMVVKAQHVGVVPGIAEFLREATGEAAIGPEGYLTAKGLIPLPDEERRQARQTALALTR